MFLWGLHREDVKAAIRKRYRSLGAFERAEKLGKNSVADVLRGRVTKRTEDAIERVLREAGVISDAMVSDSTESVREFHAQNAGAN